MLHLKTSAGERLEIPASCITAVMKPCDGANPCAIIFDMGAGAQIDQLSDQYGFVKKAVIDSMGIINPVELRIIEQIRVGEGDNIVVAHKEGRVFISRERIEGRREVKDDPNGVRAKLFANLFNQPGKTTPINVADTLDEIDGLDPEDQPDPSSRKLIAKPTANTGERTCPPPQN